MALGFNDLFDAGYYLLENGDVRLGVERGEIAPLNHFAGFGQFEFRDPGPFFDTRFYVSTNSDLTQVPSPYAHFIEFGQFERRNPTPLFDTRFYLGFNPDVGQAVEAGTVTAYEHFFRYGQFENRNASPYFDTSFYLERNPDVAAAIAAGTFGSAFEHFAQYGQFEARDPHPLFNSAFYLAENPDVAAAVNAGNFSAFGHFVQFGQFEQRTPTTLFDPQVYTTNNPDVVAALGAQVFFNTVFEHFVTFGQPEGRAGDADGIPVHVVGGFAWTQSNSVTTAAVVEGAIEGTYNTSFGQNLIAFNFNNSIGRLIAGTTGTSARATIFPSIGGPPELIPNRDRTTIQLTWGGNLLRNGPGNDFVVYEPGNPLEPEAYMVRVQRSDGSFSPWRYEFADSFQLLNPTNAEGVFATGFDLTNFGFADNETIRAIELRNVFNNAAAVSEDRATGVEGQGNILFPGDPGYASGFSIRTGPRGPAPDSLYTADRLDADFVYVAGLYDLVPAMVM